MSPTCPTPLVMAVFSGTEVDEALFERASGEARTRGARLLLLDVRHERRADRLRDFLSGDSFLPGQVLERLRESVKDQRDRAVRLALDSFVETARGRGLTAESLEVKGPYEESVRATVRQREVTLVVLDRHAPVPSLEELCEVVAV